MDAEQQWVCQVDLVRKATPEEHQDGYAAQRVAAAMGGIAVGILCESIMVLPESVATCTSRETLNLVCKQMRSDKAVTVLHICDIRPIGKLKDYPWAQPS